MLEGITTRVQEEIGLFQKDVEKIEEKLGSIINQLWLDIRTSLEAMGVEVWKMFEQCMVKIWSSSMGACIKEFGTYSSLNVKLNAVKGSREENRVVAQAVIGHINLTEASRVQTKYSKI